MAGPGRHPLAGTPVLSKLMTIFNPPTTLVKFDTKTWGMISQPPVDNGTVMSLRSWMTHVINTNTIRTRITSHTLRSARNGHKNPEKIA